jgi:hypothetical protein
VKERKTKREVKSKQLNLNRETVHPVSALILSLISSFSCPSQYELARERRQGLLTHGVESRGEGRRDEG